ncbi:ABC transporter ATP-binding protein [Streptomyces sp. KN37]|uniref:ABC transporter ATP-binding protein n=1 Tax=Streptomyces sp. KN37 TaxID=3090667 RepID=UPI002A74F92A|nr:ABC transporter ATP-binding protein [Streptomyces sp. KN37]WPO70373.1 ABC transporter ATP-binding protein [Streptomyces sp. KN37]
MNPHSARRPRPAPAPGSALSLVGLARSNCALLCCAAALAWCATGINLALPWTISLALVSLLHDEPITEAVTGLTLMTLAAAASQAGCGRLLARFGERMVLDLRERLTQHVLAVSLPDVRERGAGDLSTQIIFGTTQVRTAVESGLVHLPPAAAGVMTVLTAMTCLDTELTLLTVGAFALVGGPLALVLAGTRRTAAAQQEALARLSQRLHAVLQTLTTVKAFRYETTATSVLARAAADLGAASIKTSRLQAVVAPLVALAQQLALVVVTGAAVHRIGERTLSLTTFSTFFFLLLCLANPMTVVALGVGHLRAGQAARARIERLLALPVEAEVPSPSLPRPVRPTRGVTVQAVAFRRVFFAHPGSAPAFTNLSFTVPPTGLTVLVGPSGAGKSTVLALITRLLRTDHGDIHVLGENVGAWQLSQLRRRVAYVEQQAALWEGTVEENLRMGCGNGPSEDALWDALDTVGLSETVEQLPQRLDTPLGGSRLLSGGQCQRLCLARALLTDAELFLLDEPTSQLDTLGEQHVLRALDRLATTRPVLMATHRQHAVLRASHVITMPPLPHVVGRTRPAHCTGGTDIAVASTPAPQR